MSAVSSRRVAQTKQWFTRRTPAVVAGVGFLLLWVVIARLIDNNRIFADIPYTVNSLRQNSDTVFIKITETFTSVVVAFVIAVLLGVLLGLVIAEIFALRQMTMPVVIFAYSVPHPVLAPMFVIWFIVFGDVVLFSFTGPSAYLLNSVSASQATQTVAINGVTTFGAWVGFFPVFISTVTGMNELEERFEHLGTLLGASRWQMVKHFRFWRALPNITSSIKSAVQLSIIGVIVAEFIAASSGIGYEIVLAWKTNSLGYMFGVIVVIMIGAYLFFQIAVWTTKVLTPPGSVS